ncbi:VOC family protein [Cellulomonas sp. KRMCY2]|uniref:VOC family protein n=1 Tax=Cellulomonas sp. KRMCY2 TaxID=1304865 RepID=UPI00045E89A3|nr:VOC family protein [Cellulomonas sp. KRMCY2]
MAIHNVLINVSDVARSADFYARLLGGQQLGAATADGAVLDFVTATIELRRVDGAVPSTWHEDDQHLGFRHVGFKVAQVDPLVAELRLAGVPFRLEPVDAVGGVRIAFFFDPDGTVLEVVEGNLQYHDVVDRDAVAAERATATPSRPRFDHVGVTIRDLAATADLYRPLGFQNIGTLFFQDDPRGFRIDYLKGGGSVIEVFSFDVEVFPVPPLTDALGFLAVELEGDATALPQLSTVGTVAGRTVYADANDFAVMVGR